MSTIKQAAVAVVIMVAAGLLLAPTVAMGADLTVSTSSQLAAALKSAQPGQTIVLKDGTYSGTFRVTARPGTAAKPITLRGSRLAVLDAGATYSATVLTLKGSSYWNLVGFRTTGGQKGVMVDSSSHVTLDGLDVGDVGQEAVHFRNFSSDGTVQNSLIHDTGKVDPGYGEGIYLGSAQSNWSSVSGGLPDASNNIAVLNNQIRATAAENIDVKEATTGGVITGNSFDAAGLSGANFADSAIDVKGSGYTISANTAVGTNPNVLDVFQTHAVTTDGGRNNTFQGNVLNSPVPGYGIRVDGAPNVVRCDNTASRSALGLANVACTP